ncbi:hypothetical protein HDF26_001191 [Pedobacter cryoconitis]|uniref:hypothetical protein n=1 Tax=Pedobacter cryoconitis TaxID=188932 RepID=UPI001610F3C4|nr:hypothetical protein [Pedobacter cryoconitis]MBB6270764.1 hypothetical protein [Pedobacter cryoconitis]
MKHLKQVSLSWPKQLLLIFILLFTLNSCKDKDTGTPESVNNPVKDNTGDQWNTANLTNYESYAQPGSEECRNFNGCEYPGKFAFLENTQLESWVKANNIVAIHSKDAGTYKLKTLRLKQGNNEIDVKVYDQCSDSDCNGCCTINAHENGQSFLIDIEKYTMQRFGSGSGIVQWRCLDCK